MLTEIIVNTATNFFGITEITNKESKGWWSKDIKIARNNLKKAKHIYSKRQTPINHNTVQEKKLILNNLIKNSKLNLYKKHSDFLNNSKDSTQFWHRYEKVLGTKKNNLIEPLFDSTSNTYIFEDSAISEILYNHHIKKDHKPNKYDDSFKNQITKLKKSSPALL